MLGFSLAANESPESGIRLHVDVRRQKIVVV